MLLKKKNFFAKKMLQSHLSSGLGLSYHSMRFSRKFARFLIFFFLPCVTAKLEFYYFSTAAAAIAILHDDIKSSFFPFW